MMDESEILTALQAEFSQAALFPDTEKALNYYLGNPLGNEQPGRSQVISTDVADSIEWIMPQVMKALTEQDEVVTFEPLHPGDEKQASLESAYVYDVLMKENNGFSIIHQFVKDALIHRNGMLKVWYEDEEKVSSQRYTGLTYEQLMALIVDEGSEVVERTTRTVEGADGEDLSVFDVRIECKEIKPRIRIVCVPVEEFRINNDHNSIILDDARFAAHVRNITRSDLIGMGYKREMVDDLPVYTENPSFYRMAAQGESPLRLTPMDKSTELVSFAECFMKLDINGDGIAEYVKVCTAGGGGLTQTSGPSGFVPTKVLDWQELDYCPWVATTPILMGHKFQGLSIYDRVKSIQEVKTALTRSNLDNTYLLNNQRPIIMEGQVNQNDLLQSRPGAPIRVKNMAAIAPFPTTPLPGDSYKQLEYWDQIRAGRTGVDANGQASPINVGGSAVGSQGVIQMLNESQELVGLIVRTIAETGIKPLCYKIRDLLTRHVDAIQDYQFRNQWVQVNPATWKPRPNCTVRVGTGSGNRAQKTGALQQIFNLQSQLAQSPFASMALTPIGVFNAIDDFCKWTGLGGAERYFLDPTSPQGQQAMLQANQSQQAQAAQAAQIQQLQIQQQLEFTKAEAKIADANMLAVQSKHELTLQKQNYEARIQQLQTELDAAKQAADAHNKNAEIELEYEKLRTEAALKLTEMELTAKQQAQQLEHDARNQINAEVAQ